jgi:predicted DNA-binding transcriptional regulator AlpA
MRCGDEVIEYMNVNQLGFSIGWKDLSPKHRIMRLPEVKTITGLSRSTIYFRIAEGTFPKQVSLGRTRSRLAGERNPRMARTSGPNKPTKRRQERFVELMQDLLPFAAFGVILRDNSRIDYRIGISHSTFLNSGITSVPALRLSR